MTYDEWIKYYKPIQNHLNINATCEGTMFETFGDELKFIKEQEPNKVWTWIEGDEGQDVIVNGYAFVNRLGYFVTEEPFTGDWLEIELND